MRDGFIRSEYLQSTGNEYINTYVKPTGKTKIVIDFQMVNQNTTSLGIIGARNSDGSNRLTLFSGTSTSGLQADYSTYASLADEGDSINGLDLNKRNIIELSNSLVVNGTTVKTVDQISFSSSNNIYIFANNNGTTQLPSSMKVFSCKIYEDGTLVRDFVPCLEESSGHIGLYDNISDIFFRPFGTGNPVLKIETPIVGSININGAYKTINNGYVNINGSYKPISQAYMFKDEEYTKLDYIQSNGNQYINTEVLGDSDIKIVTEFAVTKINSSGTTFVFGSQGTDSIRYTLGITSSGAFRSDYGSEMTSGPAVTLNKKYTITKDKNVCTIDGTAVTSTAKTFTGTTNIYLFGRSYSSLSCSSIRMYSCKIYKNNVLVRDFIPVKRNSDNIRGLYDKTNNKFYCNDYSEKDKISYDKRSCIETTYKDYDGITNAKWTYNSSSNYAAHAKVSINNDGNIEGTAYILMKPDASDAIKFSIYDYDNGYAVPYTNLNASDCTFVSIKITDVDTVSSQLVTNSSISIDNNHIMHFSAYVPTLLTAKAGSYNLVINVARNSVSCSMTIPLIKTNTFGRYFSDDCIEASTTLTKNDFFQGKYSGAEIYKESPRAIGCSRYIPLVTNITGITNIADKFLQFTVVPSSISLDGLTVLYYDSRGSFLSSEGTSIPNNAAYFTFSITDSNEITPNSISSVQIDTYINGRIYSPSTDRTILNFNSLYPICKIKTITSKSYTAKVLVPTWTITSKAPGASYGFNLASDGYYTSSNNGVNNSASVCRVNFTNNTGAAYTVKFNCINYAESTFDYGIIGKINTALDTSNTSDSTYTKSFSGSQSSSVQTVTLSVPTGTSWVDVKYRKDSSQHHNNDSLKFKITT